MRSTFCFKRREVVEDHEQNLVEGMFRFFGAIQPFFVSAPDLLVQQRNEKWRISPYKRHPACRMPLGTFLSFRDFYHARLVVANARFKSCFGAAAMVDLSSKRGKTPIR